MIVARQFIAWNVSKEATRPRDPSRRDGVIRSERRATIGRLINWGRDQTVPYGTDSQLDVFQATNCLATIT